MPVTWTEPEIAVEHRGVKIFHTYKGGEYVMEYWYTLDESDDDGDNDYGSQFDIRDLDLGALKLPDGFDPNDHKALLRVAIEAGTFLKGYAECPFCNRDNSEAKECDADDCPGVMAANGADYNALIANQSDLTRALIAIQNDPAFSGLDQISQQVLIAALDGNRLPTSTPNGFDYHWIEAINQVMEDREVAARITDITGETWDAFIGPMCDAITEQDETAAVYAE